MEFAAVLILLMLVFFGEIYVYHRYGLKGLSYRCRFSRSEMTEGESLEFLEILENNKRLPVPWLKVELTVPKWLRFPDAHSVVTDKFCFVTGFFSADGKSRVRRIWQVQCEKRGIYQIARVNLVTSDLLGAVRLSFPATDIGGTLTVFPQRFVQNGLLLPQLIYRRHGDVPVRFSYEHVSSMPAGIRAYAPGDAMRQIHWKATAHAGELLVREEEYTAWRTVTVLLSLDSNKADAGRRTQDTALLEHTIRVAAECLWELFRDGWVVRLFISETDEEEHALETFYAGGVQAYQNTLHLLATLKLKKTLSLSALLRYGRSPDTALFLITPLTDDSVARWKLETGGVVLVTGHAHDYGECADVVVPAFYMDGKPAEAAS